MATKEHDTIGFDPVRWLDRLDVVNDCSQFTREERAIISNVFAMLREQLVREAIRVQDGK